MCVWGEGRMGLGAGAGVLKGLLHNQTGFKKCFKKNYNVLIRKLRRKTKEPQKLCTQNFMVLTLILISLSVTWKLFFFLMIGIGKQPMPNYYCCFFVLPLYSISRLKPHNSHRGDLALKVKKTIKK